MRQHSKICSGCGLPKVGERARVYNVGWGRKRLVCVPCDRKRRKTIKDRQRKRPEKCGIEGCTRPLYARGKCQGHYRREMRNQPVDATPLQGDDPWGWRQLSDAALAYGNAESKEQYLAASRALARAARGFTWKRYSRGNLGRTPDPATSPWVEATEAPGGDIQVLRPPLQPVG